MQKHMFKVSLALIVLTTLPSRVSAQFSIEIALKTIDAQYEKTQKNKSVSEFVCLDSMLRAFVESAQRNLPFNRHPKYWKDEYIGFGLSLGAFSDRFQYSGRFLYEAHILNPNSAYRRYTLYAGIVGIDDTDGLGRFPSIATAFDYVREFHQGPFAADVYAIIGDFYKDLFMVLRDGKEAADYHYDCYAKYIDSTAVAEQRIRAQEISIEYYEKALAVQPDNTYAKEILKEVRDGTVSSWSNCTD